MASIYLMSGEGVISEGLQGCVKCDEALQAAERWADRRGESVELYDDDGRWEVFPAVWGLRPPARFLGDELASDEPEDE